MHVPLSSKEWGVLALPVGEAVWRRALSRIPSSGARDLFRPSPIEDSLLAIPRRVVCRPLVAQLNLAGVPMGQGEGKEYGRQ